MLAKRMIKRGEDVPPNTRLEYLFLKLKNETKDTKQGDKAEDYTFYKNNKQRLSLKIDPLYYLEKQLAIPLTELINVKYKKKEIPFKPLYDEIHDAIIKQSLLANTIITIRKNRCNTDVTIKQACKDWYKSVKKTYKNGRIVDDPIMKVKDKEALIEKMLIAVRRNISKKNSDILDLMKRWKQKKLMEKLYKKSGIRRTKKEDKFKLDKNGNKIRIIDEDIMDQLYLNHRNYGLVIQKLNELFQDGKYVVKSNGKTVFEGESYGLKKIKKIVKNKNKLE
jgi:hypothetical protein